MGDILEFPNRRDDSASEDADVTPEEASSVSDESGGAEILSFAEAYATASGKRSHGDEIEGRGATSKNESKHSRRKDGLEDKQSQDIDNLLLALRSGESAWRKLADIKNVLLTLTRDSDSEVRKQIDSWKKAIKYMDSEALILVLQNSVRQRWIEEPCYYLAVVEALEIEQSIRK